MLLEIKVTQAILTITACVVHYIVSYWYPERMSYSVIAIGIIYTTYAVIMVSFYIGLFQDVEFPADMTFNYTFCGAVLFNVIGTMQLIEVKSLEFTGKNATHITLELIKSLLTLIASGCFYLGVIFENTTEEI